MRFVNHVDEIKKYFNIWKRQFVSSNNVLRYANLEGIAFNELMEADKLDPNKSIWKRICATKSVFLKFFTERRSALVISDRKFQPLCYTNAMTGYLTNRKWCQSGKCYDDCTIRFYENEWFSTSTIYFDEIKEVVYFYNAISPQFSFIVDRIKRFCMVKGVPLKPLKLEPKAGTCMAMAFPILKEITSIIQSPNTALPFKTNRSSFFAIWEWDFAYLLDSYNGFEVPEVRYSYNRKPMPILDTTIEELIAQYCNLAVTEVFQKERDRKQCLSKLLKYVSEILAIYFDI